MIATSYRALICHTNVSDVIEYDRASGAVHQFVVSILWDSILFWCELNCQSESRLVQLGSCTETWSCERGIWGVGRRHHATAEDGAHWQVYSTYCRVCKFVVALYLSVVSSYECSINTITNPKTVSRHSSTWQHKNKRYVPSGYAKRTAEYTNIASTCSKNGFSKDRLNDINLGLHLDRRLTWHKRIFTKRKQLGLTVTKMNWLLGRKSQLSTNNKLLLYKTILKPIWTYGIQLCGTVFTSNIKILERF
jgi:hypothetical protein